MTLRRGLALAAVAAAGLAGGTAPAAATADAPASTAGPDLQLIDQTFVVPGIASADALQFTIAGEALSASGCETATGTIRVVAYRAVTTVEAAAQALEEPGPEADDAEYDLCTSARNPNGSITLSVATTIQAATDPSTPSLRLAGEGIVPVRVEVVRAGDVDGSFTTFVDRLTTGTDAATPVEDRMQVALAFLVDGGPTLRPGGGRQLTAADRSAVRNAIDLLERTADAPITLGVRPELLEGMAASPTDASAFEELAAALSSERVSVVSLPYVAVDPSAAATSGAADLFREQLTDGENVFRALIPEVRLQRYLWLFDRPVSAEGADLLRNSGVQLAALLPPQAVPLVPSDRQFEIAYDDGTLPSTPVNADIAAALADPGADPTLTAYHLAARVVLQRQEAIDATFGFAPMRDHNMILSTPDGRIGNLTTTFKLAELLNGIPELALVPATSITSSSIPGPDGQPYAVPPEPADIPSIGAMANELANAHTTADAVASMLPADDERPAAWDRQLDVAASSALTAEQRAEHVEAVRGGIDEVRGAIVPIRASKFTLGGRHSTIRLTLTNSGPDDLRVRLIIDSTKLEIALEDANREVLLPAGESREIEIPVEARTNGQFPVDVSIVTPGNDDVAVTERVSLTARVNALTGLGQLATGAFVLILLSWWVQHLRKRRRAAAAAATA